MPNRMHSTRAARAHQRRQPIVFTCDAVINIYTTVILLRITQAKPYTMEIDYSNETSTLFILFRRKSLYLDKQQQQLNENMYETHENCNSNSWKWCR